MAGKVSSDPNIFILPDLGEGLEEAELIKWTVKEGDTVGELEVIAEMETDKALVEVPSPRAGTIKTLHGNDGDTIKVGAPFVTYEGGPDDAPTAAPAPASAVPAEEERPDDQGSVVGQMSDHTPGMTAANGKAIASPAVRRQARDAGVDINTITGTGIGGRVTAKDVRGAASGSAPAKTASAPTSTPEPAPVARPTETRRPLNLPTTPVAPAYSPQQPQPAQYIQQPPMQQPAYGYAPPPPAYPYPPQYANQYPYGYAPPPPPPGYGYPQPMPQQQAPPAAGFAVCTGLSRPGCVSPDPKPGAAEHCSAGARRGLHSVQGHPPNDRQSLA